MSDLKVIDIRKYTTKFSKYPNELIDFCESNLIRLPNINSMRGQALALMAQIEIRGKKYITRKEADIFFKQISISTKDSIQAFNKPTGLKRVNIKGRYCLVYPFVTDINDIEKRKNIMICQDRDECINSIKDWWRNNLIDIPNKHWHIGHLDPTITNTDNNLAYQPPIQARYRNRFKWDRRFHKMWPTATELISKLNTYYTQTEQEIIYKKLESKFIRLRGN